jgi:para-nitrobenzyl esterase
MSEAWVAFAADGDPDSRSSGLPVWPVYHPDTRATMLFDDVSRVANDPAHNARVALKGALSDI